MELGDLAGFKIDDYDVISFIDVNGLIHSVYDSNWIEFKSFSINLLFNSLFISFKLFKFFD